ncbi:MAG: hypothetical protein EOL86_07445 [Deltaproteobacteria bacterium]|nr:hypothetical protein [Deltaproteobacteria bacterium]
MLDIFSERIVNVQIHQGIARLDFARLESVNSETKEVTLKPAMRLVMPLAAFMEMADHVGKIRENILKQMPGQVGGEDQGPSASFKPKN